MEALKTLPIAYTGELHQIRLIALSVAKEEVLPFLPNGIDPVIENERVQFSLVSVQLKGMRAGSLPIAFGYHHVALRLRIKDSKLNESKKNQGVYFYNSYTNRPLIVLGGKMLTSYNLNMAEIKYVEPVLDLSFGEKFIRFALDTSSPRIGKTELFESTQLLDRAYFVRGEKMFRTVVTRKHWPIRWADCYAFETNFFNDYKVEGAFYIEHPVTYQWNKPELVASIL